MNAIPRDALPRLRAAISAADWSHATKIGEGYGSAAFRVPDPAGDWSVRLPRPEVEWAIPDLEREAKLLPGLEGRISTAETPREASVVRAEDGALIAAVHRFVDGEPPSIRTIRGAKRERIASQIAAFLRELHTVPRSVAKRHSVREMDLWPDRYQPLIANTLQHLGPAGRAWLEAQSARFEAAGGTSDAPRVLIHGDIAGPHLLLDDDSNLSGVIDFGDAMLADPALDFAGILNEFSWAFLERVLAHYGAVDAGARERARFYIDVVPIFQVLYGWHVRDGAERRQGIRRFAVRAGIASRQESEDSPANRSDR
jgi:aminoglycoside phosphotransferase (APT) family kinase protein